MNKCKHQSVIIGETGYEEIWYRIDEKNLIDSGHKQGSISERITATCLDCDRRFEGNRYSKSLPQWVKAALIAIEE